MLHFKICFHSHYHLPPSISDDEKKVRSRVQALELWFSKVAYGEMLLDPIRSHHICKSLSWGVWGADVYGVAPLHDNQLYSFWSSLPARVIV